MILRLITGLCGLFGKKSQQPTSDDFIPFSVERYGSRVFYFYEDGHFGNPRPHYVEWAAWVQKRYTSSQIYVSQAPWPCSPPGMRLEFTYHNHAQEMVDEWKDRIPFHNCEADGRWTHGDSVPVPSDNS